VNDAGKVCDTDTRSALCDATDTCNRESHYASTFTAAPESYHRRPARVTGRSSTPLPTQGAADKRSEGSISSRNQCGTVVPACESVYAASMGGKGEQSAADALAATVGVRQTIVQSEQARALNRTRGAVSVATSAAVTGQGDVVGYATTYGCVLLCVFI
jgi:hypothetical protein